MNEHLFQVLCFLFFSMTILLLSNNNSRNGQGIGVSYGKVGDNLPPPAEVVALYKQYNIGKMRIYEPNHEILEALRGSNIELILGVPNTDLPALATNPSVAAQWVATNVRSYFPDVKIKYIAVGNEVNPNNDNARFAPILVPAMKNIFEALAGTDLQGQIKVSTAINMGLLGISYPPSAGTFNSDFLGMTKPLIEFLSGNGQPILVNLYPYFSYKGDSTVPLPYAIFTNPNPQFTDSGNNLQYWYLFDAMLDAVYAALEKAGGANLKVVISETGWPSAGGNGASIENAQTYNQKLIDHVKTGSPKKPGVPIEAYLFAMFNEDQKPGEATEKNFGLFYPTKEPVYPITFG
ncbi:putative glucan endo-1 [Ranunculus cassubicifolius]